MTHDTMTHDDFLAQCEAVGRGLALIREAIDDIPQEPNLRRLGRRAVRLACTDPHRLIDVTEPALRVIDDRLKTATREIDRYHAWISVLGRVHAYAPQDMPPPTEETRQVWQARAEFLLARRKQEEDAESGTRATETARLHEITGFTMGVLGALDIRWDRLELCEADMLTITRETANRATVKGWRAYVMWRLDQTDDVY